MKDSLMVFRMCRTPFAVVLLVVTATAVAAAQDDQPSQTGNKDSRYYVHVSGIT